MLVRLVDLGVAFVYILGCLDGVLLRVLDHRVLSFYDLGHVCEHSSQFCESAFNALELVVASTNSAEN